MANKFERKFRRMKQKMRAWWNKAKKKLPSQFKKYWLQVAVLFMCAMLVEMSSKMLPFIADYKVFLALAAGRWAWPLGEKAFKKLKEMR